MNFVVTERKSGNCEESMTDTSNTSDAGNRRGIIVDRVSPLVDREFVLFLIGMRINRMLMVPKWWLVFRAMSRMLKELSADPESGLAHFRLQRGLRNFMVVQYWDSWEKLEAYARDPGRGAGGNAPGRIPDRPTVPSASGTWPGTPATISAPSACG